MQWKQLYISLWETNLCSSLPFTIYKQDARPRAGHSTPQAFVDSFADVGYNLSDSE